MHKAEAFERIKKTALAVIDEEINEEEDEMEKDVLRSDRKEVESAETVTGLWSVMRDLGWDYESAVETTLFALVDDLYEDDLGPIGNLFDGWST